MPHDTAPGDEHSYVDEAVRWPTAGNRGYLQTGEFAPVNLLDELTFRGDKILDYYNIALQKDRNYPEFPMEQAVDNQYFSIRAEDGSIRHYVLQVRNANTENLNLDYMHYRTDESEQQAYALWAYANGTPGVEDGTAEPNAQPYYRAMDGSVTPLTQDGDGVALQRFTQVVDKYGQVYRDGDTWTDPETNALCRVNLIVPETYAVAQFLNSNQVKTDYVWGTDTRKEEVKVLPADVTQDPAVEGNKIPAIQKIYVGEENGRKVYEYRLVPTTFYATVDRSATDIVVRAVAEYKYSGVLVDRNDGNYMPQFGEDLKHITVSVGSDATVYIYIRSQNEQLIGNRADTARRYTLNLNRANDTAR